MKLVGKFAGQVMNVLDPKKLGRVKALVEGAGFVSTPTPWAFPAAARFKGEFAVPDVGDNIWVEFENGNPNRPLWSPGFWSEPNAQSETPGRARGEVGSFPKGSDSCVTASGETKTEPADPFAAVYPKNRVIQTAAGHLIEIDDSPGAERIHVWAKGGSFFEFHPDGKVVMKSAGDRYVYVTGNDVLHATGKIDLVADSDVGVKGANVKLKGTAKIAGESVSLELGLGPFLALVDSRIVALHNAHTHPFGGFFPGVGTGVTSAPSVPIVEANVTTANTKAS